MKRLRTPCRKKKLVSKQSVEGVYLYPLGIIDTNAHLLWKEGYTGRGAKIGIIDAGISFHRDLKGRVVYRKSYVGDIVDAHGTHVAGIIAANPVQNRGVYGMAPNSTLYDIQILRNNDGCEEDFASAIDDAIALDLDILNISLGTMDRSPLIENAVRKAYAAGMILVAASGNYGKGTVLYPGAMKECISVGNYDVNAHRYNSTMSSNPYMDVCAPGTEIFSCDLGGDYGVYSGTSMAAPHVSGLCALYIEKIKASTSRALSKAAIRDNIYNILKINAVEPSGADSLIVGGKRIRYRIDVKPYIDAYTRNRHYYVGPKIDVNQLSAQRLNLLHNPPLNTIK